MHDLMICLVFRLHPPPSAIPNKGNEKNCKNIASIFTLFWLLNKINVVLSAHKYITFLLTANNKLWKGSTYAISTFPRLCGEEEICFSLIKQTTENTEIGFIQVCLRNFWVSRRNGFLYSSLNRYDHNTTAPQNSLAQETMTKTKINIF